MKIFFMMATFLSFIVMASLYIVKEDGSLDKELKSVSYVNKVTIIKLHEKFSKLDMKSENFDVESVIVEVDKALKLYPLDDKLKTLKLELNNKRANKTY